MPGAGIWTSEAASAPTSRHLSGEAWPREHMHVEYERSGTEHAGTQAADDQPKQCITLFTTALFRKVSSQSPVAHRDHTHTL